MATEIIEVRYLITAVDQADATIRKIDKSLGSLRKNLAASEKATEDVEKSTGGLLKQYNLIGDTLNDTTDLVIKFYKSLTTFDFERFAGILRVISRLLRLKGLDVAADAVDKFADGVEVAGDKVANFSMRLDEARETYGSLTKAFLEVSGINNAIEAIGEATLTVGFLGTAIVALAASSTATLKISAGLRLVGFEIAKIQGFIQATFGEQFPRATLIAANAVFALRRAVLFIDFRFLALSKRLKGVSDFAKGFAATTKDLGGSLGKAALASEIMEKGLFGMTAKFSAGSIALSGFGKLLLEADSKMIKVIGTIAILSAIALGGLAVAIRSFVIEIGAMITAVGVGLTGALAHASEEMRELKGETFIFAFVIRNLNQETQGASGSVEEWTMELDKLQDMTGIATGEIQKSISELVRFGNSIGLTKQEMQTLLPVIADLAEANHKDLFQSTLAVVEALAGQTVMLQNMGVNLGLNALAESKRSKELGKSVNKLNEHEKVALRFNVLMDKARVVQGLSAASAETLTGALRRQETATQKLNVSLGEGANIIETLFNRNLAQAADILETFSEPILRVAGFVGALSGRVFQAVGIFLQWSFAIIFIASSIKALNILLQSQIISRWTLALANSVFVTETLAAKNFILASSFRSVLLSISAGGLKLTSIFKVLTTVLIGTAKAAFLILLPFIKIVAVIAIVAGLVFLLVKALQAIDKETKIFTDTWNRLLAAWNESGLLDEIVKRLKELGALLLGTVNAAVIKLAQSFVAVFVAVQAAQAGFLNIKVAMRDLVAEAGLIATKLPGGFLRLIGINSAYAKGLKDLKLTSKGFTDEEKRRSDSLNESIKSNILLINKLGMANDENAAKTRTNNTDQMTSHQELFDFIQLLEEGKALSDLEKEELEKVNQQVKADENFLFLQEQLGKEAALRALAKAQELSEEGKAGEAKILIAKKIADAQAALAKKLKIVKEITAKAELANQRKLGDQQLSLAAAIGDATLALTGDNQVAALALAKGVAVAGVLISKARAEIDAVAAATRLDIILPGAGEVYLSKQIPLINAAAGIALGTIAATTVAAVARFQDGGIVQGPRTGDSVAVRANGGEMFLNQAQQASLFRQINDGAPGANNTAEAITNLAEAILEQPMVTEIDGREIARSNRRQRLAGFEG